MCGITGCVLKFGLAAPKLHEALKRLEYRGYDIHDLAKNSSFEEVTYLLLFGDLPKKKELDLFKEELKERRELPPQIIGLLTLLPTFTHPMVVLSTTKNTTEKRMSVATSFHNLN